MKTKLNFIKLFTGSVAVAALLCLPLSSPAQGIRLALDPSQSYLDISGMAFGLSFTPQAAGATRAYYGGTMSAQITPEGLAFTGGSTIVGLVNPAGPFSSVPYPGGPWPGNYGVMSGPTLVPPYGIVTVNGTYVGLTLDLTAGSAQNGVAPSGVNDRWTGGTLLWGANTSAYGPFGGASSMAGIAGLNTSANLVSWDGTTLILPVKFHTVGSNRYEDWDGQLVATVIVPEPTTAAMVILGVGLLAIRRRRS
jgi:hypothetical protein